MSDGICVHDDGAVRCITINRPERKNALDVETRRQFADLIVESHANPQVRAIVFTGAGGDFCAGADIKKMVRSADGGAAYERIQAAQEIARVMAEGPKPQIAAVDGAAVGLGMGIALACDYIVAGPSARFAGGFVKVGLCADNGVLFTLPQRVGPARARTMMLLSETVCAEEALRIGLIDKLAESADDVLPTAIDVAATLAAGPPLAITAISQAFNALPATFSDALQWEIELQVPLLCSEDHREAAAAFAEKRAPVFTGR
ncbi:enoyl-CoA hydratase-related protein [Mycobacterium sp. CVI_P3]|uniref:Enoyl-CoA hydratase-related protein n=1 Tax=Mycobacterium pinniadriaticum TaxID=2994102 RepID=A0ABT3SNY1_9MYCO|nr:enoyl-CoA hydratase-related protein [Mycobacterium pinniadriaticum]MCX2934431.1 enoyl-CoA hydratase-related protein [Mycobacterium pinniadriaticum]MCX2940854.1 enoyl-CoA hydratase-related protein [Mycobacterium pinniadriaticum]